MKNELRLFSSPASQNNNCYTFQISSNSFNISNILKYAFICNNDKIYQKKMLNITSLKI